MKRCAALAILAGLFVGTGVGQAQPVTIKLKERGEGEAALVRRNAATTTAVTVTDAMGQVLVDQKQRITEIDEYKETVHKRAAGKSATKLEREYTKVQNGKDDEFTNGPLQGKTVIIEKKGDKYVFTYKDGATVEDKAAAGLIKDFSKKTDKNSELERLVLPANAVKTGESWKIDMPKVAGELAKEGVMEVDADKSTGQGTLVKTYKKNGLQFGEMKFKMEMPIVTVGKGKEIQRRRKNCHRHDLRCLHRRRLGSRHAEDENAHDRHRHGPRRARRHGDAQRHRRCDASAA